MAPARAHVLGMELHDRKAIKAATGKKRTPDASITANRLRKTGSAHSGDAVPAWTNASAVTAGETANNTKQKAMATPFRRSFRPTAAANTTPSNVATLPDPIA